MTKPISVKVCTVEEITVRSSPVMIEPREESDIQPLGILLTTCQLSTSPDIELPDNDDLRQLLGQAGGYHFTSVSRVSFSIIFGMSRVEDPMSMLRIFAANVSRHMAGRQAAQI